MSKIILEFDGIEESEEAQSAIDGDKWKHAFWELDQELRNTTKHGVSIIDRNLQASEMEIETCSRIREMIIDILNDSNLKIN